MNDSAKSALPSLVAKALAAELIRLPLFQTELALQSQDFLISFAYIMPRRCRRAFCGQNSSEFSEIRRQKEDYSTRLISDLRVLRHDKNTIGLNKNTATPITFIPRAHWNINS